MNGTHDVSAVVLAAGRGARFGGHKQFAPVGAARLVDLSIRTVASIASTVVVVLPPEVRWDGAGVGVTGGATRSASVRSGLACIPATTEIVLVHDAAHPLATPELAATLVRSIRKGADAAVPVLATREVIAHVDGGELRSAISRDGLVIVQMPHAFRAPVLRALHAPAQEAVDDASLALSSGYRVVTVEGEPANVHVTDPRELELVRRLVTGNGPH